LYIKGKSHFVASSEQDPACVVEPGTPEDVGKIVRTPIQHPSALSFIHTSSGGKLNVIEATKTPFAVGDRSFIPVMG
jgi:hypothetical protein